jgi:hypothetical protein
MSLFSFCHWIFFLFFFSRLALVSSNTPGDRGNVTHKWLVQPAVSMNASHHSLSPAARLLIWWWWWRLFNISFLFLSRRDRNRLKTIHKHKDILPQLLWNCFVFWAVSVIFSGEIQSVRGGRLCVSFVCRWETDSSHTNTQHKKKKKPFFFFLFLLFCWPQAERDRFNRLFKNPCLSFPSKRKEEEKRQATTILLLLPPPPLLRLYRLLRLPNACVRD